MDYGEEENVVSSELFSDKLRITVKRSNNAEVAAKTFRIQVRDYTYFQRQKYGVHQTLLRELLRSHEDNFTNYLRANMHAFEDLRNFTEAAISKQQTKFR